uniref:CUB domain-containing protein n=1 Tax=Romanomermis culicivorax TaxID=13658 RepID=A0A915KXP7_ROMCU
YLRCGGKIDLVSIGSSSTFTSPNYPDNYSDYMQCMWFIQAPEETKILLTFNDFEMESPDSTGCYDFLEIRPSKCAAATIVPDKLRFCGKALAPDVDDSPYELLSDDNNYVIKMVTDKTDSSRGFNA